MADETGPLYIVVSSAAGRGQLHRQRAHAAHLDAGEYRPLCGARADYGYTQAHAIKRKPCPRCEAKAPDLFGRSPHPPEPGS